MIRAMVLLASAFVETLDTIVDIAQWTTFGLANLTGIPGQAEKLDDAVDALVPKALAWADSLEEGTEAFGSALRERGESLKEGEAGRAKGTVPTASEIGSFVEHIRSDDKITKGELLRVALLLEEMTELAAAGNATAATTATQLENIQEELEQEAGEAARRAAARASSTSPMGSTHR